MSTTVLSKSNPSPAVTRRPPVANENTGNASQRTADRRSLSVKLRDLFRKESSTSNTNRGSSPVAARQSSSSPGTGQPATEAPHLRAPIVQWPFGKKKTNTSTTSKKKIKDGQKTKKTKVPPTTISSPIYEQENQTSIYGQNFVPRSPVLVHGNTERIQSSSSYEVPPTNGYRDYAINDQIQQSRQVKSLITRVILSFYAISFLIRLLLILVSNLYCYSNKTSNNKNNQHRSFVYLIFQC